MVRTERSRGIRRQKGGDLTYAATEPNLQQFRDLTLGRVPVRAPGVAFIRAARQWCR
uniref:Uncharacterized protein n=1 Tax=mine drainage metagenome TaxID=410659 RepID=E6Q3A3_9ZZZZ